MDNGKKENAFHYFLTHTQKLCSQTNKQTNKQPDAGEMLNVLAYIFIIHVFV